MKSLEERVKEEMKRDRVWKKAVELADSYLCSHSDGSVEELTWLTAMVAKAFAEKTWIMANTKLNGKIFMEKENPVMVNTHTDLNANIKSHYDAGEEFDPKTNKWYKKTTG